MEGALTVQCHRFQQRTSTGLAGTKAGGMKNLRVCRSTVRSRGKEEWSERLRCFAQLVSEE